MKERTNGKNNLGYNKTSTTTTKTYDDDILSKYMHELNQHKNFLLKIMTVVEDKENMTNIIWRVLNDFVDFFLFQLKRLWSMIKMS